MYRQQNGKGRYFESGRALKLQVKSTTKAAIVQSEDSILYDLSATSYNDLIIRQSSRTPLILVLFVLPEDASQWVMTSDEALICKKCAYWYFPADGSALTDNIHSKRISIGKENLVSTNTLGLLFESFA